MVKMPATTETEVCKTSSWGDFWSYSCLHINGSPLSSRKNLGLHIAPALAYTLALLSTISALCNLGVRASHAFPFLPLVVHLWIETGVSR